MSVGALGKGGGGGGGRGLDAHRPKAMGTCSHEASQSLRLGCDDLRVRLTLR